MPGEGARVVVRKLPPVCRTNFWIDEWREQCDQRTGPFNYRIVREEYDELPVVAEPVRGLLPGPTVVEGARVDTLDFKLALRSHRITAVGRT